MIDAPVCLDFESRSRADLLKVGGRNYWAHASTEVLCCVWYDTRDGRVGVWAPRLGGGLRPPHGRTYAAHNADGFDRFASERLGWSEPDAAWVDTSSVMRTAGYPGKLEALGELVGFPKDLAASRFTKGLSACRRPTARTSPAPIDAAAWKAMTDDQRRAVGVQPELTPDGMRRVVGYCSRDVEIMAEGWPLIDSWRHLEPEMVAVNWAINNRGVPFDSDLARALLKCDARNGRKVVKRVARELGWSVEETRAAARSPQQFCEVTGAPNAQKETVAKLDHPLATARQALASIVAGKLRAGLAGVSADGILRDTHRYYGGHPGRWSSTGMQLHNMTRPAKVFEDWSQDQLCELADRVMEGEHHATPKECDFLLRATIWAGTGNALVVRDFSGVEARALAWVAGDRKALEVFKGTQDPYKVAAAAVFGVRYEDVDAFQRTVGKILELACGYGQGGKKFAETAAKMGANLAAAGIDSFAAVKAWRRLHAPSVKFWYDVEKAFRLAIEGHASRVSCFDFEPSTDGKDVAIFMPSGRPIVYPRARLGRERGRKGLSIVYAGGKTGREHTYGGKLVQNMIEGLCRDLLARTLIKAERAGLNPVLHVHDEAACLVPRRAAKEAGEELQTIMTTLPGWAKRGPHGAFPIGAKGFEGLRYRK